MKKVLALILALSLAFCLAACGQQQQQATTSASSASSSSASSETPSDSVEPITLIFCNGVDDTHPQSICLAEFATAFEEATDGRYHIENYWSNTLGDDESLAEMCRTGTIQGWYGSIFGALPNYIPEFASFALPYLLHSYDEAYDYLHNSELIAELMQKLEDEYNIHYVDTTNNGVRALTTKNTPVYSPDDLKGMKVRSMTAQIWQDVISALGGTPVPIAYSELYVSLQTGVVDAQDNGISNVYNSKFYEIQNYFMKTDHGLTLSNFCMNADTWKNMSAEDQEIFTKLWTEICVEKETELMNAYYEEGFEAVKAAGMTVIEQDEMDMQAFYDNASKLIDEKYIDDPVYGAIVNDVRAYFGR